MTDLAVPHVPHSEFSMNAWKLISSKAVLSDWTGLLVAQILCFAGAMSFLLLSIKAICRHATTPAEITIGLIAAAGTCQVMVLIGLVLPGISTKWR